MLVSKTGLYQVVGRSEDLPPEGCFIKVVDIDVSGLHTTMHTKPIPTMQPVKLVKEIKK